MVLQLKRKITLAIVLLVAVIVVFGLCRLVSWREQQSRQKAAVLFEQGEQMRLAGKYPEAIQSYKDILQKYAGYQNIPEVKFKLANVALHNLYDIPQAKEYYEQILAQKKKYQDSYRIPDTMIELATIYRYERRYNEAIALLEQTLKEYPERVDKKWAYLQLEMLYGQVGNRDKSTEMNIKRRTL